MFRLRYWAYEKGKNRGAVKITPGQTISTDIGSPLPQTEKGYRYLMTVNELHTRMKIVYLLQHKSEAEKQWIEATEKIHRHFNRHIARISCDNTNEYMIKLQYEQWINKRSKSTQRKRICLNKTVLWNDLTEN